ncbi:MAG TPA: hypothetical protein VMZ26_04760, partial [Pyrinomonadaceae bacterium]|nr:hypothetical protein [Pyrinomonadaceae bacterium]
SSKNDFDFLVGNWTIHNRKLRSRLTGSSEWVEFDASHEMHKVLAGTGNVESISATVEDRPFEGMAVRLFDPATRLWRIYWADNASGSMGDPVIGSFDNRVGTFFGKEKFKDKEVIVQFKWDATDPDKPVWSQAFSADNGKTWEWNWYMYFSRSGNGQISNLNAGHEIRVLELRNYLIKPGRRDEFINLFEENFTRSQNILGGYTLGQYRVKGADDNFFWIRGFKDMSTRIKFLNDFYYNSPDWKRNKSVANSMLLNNDNVHLLKPLNEGASNSGFSTNWFGRTKGIAVVDQYTSNTKLEKLIEFMKTKYSPMLDKEFSENTSLWISEPTPNDFTALPVFQDRNLLVRITFYKSELEYQEKMKGIDSKMDEALRAEMADLVTIKNTLIIYPTEKSFSMPN